MSTQRSLVDPESLVHDRLVSDAPVPGRGQPEAAVHLALVLLVAAVAGIAQVPFNCRHLVQLILEKSITAGSDQSYLLQFVKSLI